MGATRESANTKVSDSFATKMRMSFQEKNPKNTHLIRIIKLNYNRAVSDTISEGDKM